ncbi:hypothetical protein EJ04DRAFT_444939 [Polyplosphaeria fusca]|uniref:Uncharacterized protein n=1 Tax=Polyplosphaeria fusca TaxID=682080 RepID=A0A9P4QPX3_9PLEO|nr:hypothetical protein EJ04DRAFT_444939 [Polyplosphaeria fusca]
MADDSPSADASAQEKARMRRERRAAKLAAGGASRLKAITELQGGTHRDIEKDVPVKPTPPPRPAHASGTATPDPDEIDISTHHYSPAVTQRLPPSQPNPFAFNGSDTPPFPTQQGAEPSQDPMMAMLQQMMGANAGALPNMSGPTAGQPDHLPPGLANLFSAMQGGEAQPPPTQSSAWIWRLVHSLFSFVLSFYMISQTTFDGSKQSRLDPASLEDEWTLDTNSAETFKRFFYLFATSELALQSTRYFIEKGQLQGSGVLSSIAQFLPEPYSGYVRVVGRYSVIYRTVVNDALVVVFVLGAASWWRGGVAL